MAESRLARALVATLVIGGYMALGVVLRLSAEGYLLLGIPITIAFQALVVRRPLRALWLHSAPPIVLTPRSIFAVVAVAIAPAAIAIRGAQHGDPVLTAYGLAAIFGAIGAVYAIRAMNRDAARSAVRASLINSAILVAVIIALRLISGGFHGDLGGAVATAVISVATYVPVVFVMEEVFFRGLLDRYLHGSTAGPDRASALYGSALWGLWHLPVMSVDLGLLTIPYLVGIHTALGYVLVTSWRRTGNLAAPGIAHAVSDALRNAVSVL
ncbi:MAG TPA: CPBP family intramembrane glutamic endopeptidase [Candidatus Limnocylindrales bacterium]|nr:CPBP family intramembrane glutamic endopeptidase [Candidatus Limnocylindrales bacterium]